MKFHKPVMIAILAGLTAVNALVLALTQTPLFSILADYIEDEMTLAFIVFGLIVVLAIAMTALGYGIGVEGSVSKAGRSRRLYRRPSQAGNLPRTEKLPTSLGVHDH